MNILIKKKEKLLDVALLLPILIITSISLVFIYSSSNVIAHADFGNPFFFLQRQIVALSISLIACAVFLFIPISFYRQNGLILLLVSSILLALVLVPGIGIERNGASRWLSIGPINIQPSEIVKIFLPLYLCSYCLRRREQLESSWRGFIKPIVVTTIIGLLLFLEPDYGNTAILFSIAICILFIGGAQISQLSILTIIFITFLSIAIYFNPERLDRVLSYANPWDDMTGSDYQLINALIASVQGGLTGLGIGESTQKYFFLPEAHTDFIFSIFLEETGLLGFSVLMSCYFVILWRLFKLAETSNRQNYFFNSMLITSFALLFFIQTALNIFVNLGVIPTKGLTLPFISYGRSSVIMNFIALAITLRASWEFRNKIK
ncbi:MAG: putative lipid II flippase FtsW [Gammaproteobacteria bacterium]|nr:putative lipid II flippase FtsW [Gammaproteobacteria bacterium]